jgi:hypothetical protein
MEPATLENFLVDVVDLDFRPNATPAQRRTVRLTQSRLAIFLKDVETGRPLVGQPLFVELECDVRYQVSKQGDSEYKELPTSIFSYRIPLGLLATDHVGYASYDLSRLASLTDLTDLLPQKVSAADLQEANVQSQQLDQSDLDSTVWELALGWPHAYGKYSGT